MPLTLATQPRTVANQAARLALPTSQYLIGDLVIQDDNDSVWMLIGADTSVSNNWKQMDGDVTVALAAANAYTDSVAAAATYYTNTTAGAVSSALSSEVTRATAAEATKKNRWLDQGAAKTASISLAAWFRVKYDTTAGAITQALPSSPASGDEIYVYVSAGTNNLTLTGTGGPFTVLPLTGLTVVWTGSTWERQSSSGSSSSTVKDFYVTDPLYGGVVTASATSQQKTSNLAAFRACYAACVANGGGRIVFDAGVFDIGAASDADHGLALANTVAAVEFRGVAPGASTVRLGGAVSSLVWGNLDYTYNNITFRDLVIDDNNVLSADYAHQGWFSITGYNFNVSNILVENVQVINGGALRSVTPERRAFTIVSGNESTVQTTCTNVVFRNYRVNGNNYAAQIVGYAFNGFLDRQVYDGTANRAMKANFFIDRIHFEDCFWDSGGPLASGATGFSACGWMIGGDAGGGRVTFDNVHARNAADDLFEINFMKDVVLRNCHLENARYENIYFINYAGAFPNPDECTVLIDNCTFKATAGNAPAFIAAGGLTEHGHLTIQNSKFLNSLSIGTAARFFGNFRSVTLDNNIFQMTGSKSGTFNSEDISVTLVPITPRGGRGTIRAENNKFLLGGSWLSGGFSSVTSVITCFGITALDHDIHVKGNTVFFSGTKTISSLGLAFIRFGNPAVYTDDFVLPSINGRYFVDSGVAADVTNTSGTYLPSGTANLLTEQRRAVLSRYDTTDFTTAVGPYTDCAQVTNGKPGTTLTGFKLGALVKRISATSYIEGYIVDDGTATTLNLDIVTNGTRVQATTPVSVTRIVAGTFYWVRTRINGDVVTASLHTSAPTTPYTAGTATTSSVTLAGTDKANFGSTEQGRAGFSWIPADAASLLDNSQVMPICVGSATVEDNVVRHTTTVLNTGKGFEINPDSTLYRMRNLRVVGNDFSELANAGTVTEINVSDTFLPVFERSGNRMKDGSIDTVIGSFVAPPKEITGAYTVTRADSGRQILFNSGTPATITIPPTMPAGFNITVGQVGAGAATIATSGSGSISTTFVKTNGQTSKISVSVDYNSSGSNAIINVGGNGAA